MLTILGYIEYYLILILVLKCILLKLINYLDHFVLPNNYFSALKVFGEKFLPNLYISQYLKLNI